MLPANFPRSLLWLDLSQLTQPAGSLLASSNLRVAGRDPHATAADTITYATLTYFPTNEGPSKTKTRVTLLGEMLFDFKI